MDIKINDNKGKDLDGYIILVIDSTGIRVTNRGQWLRDNCKINNKDKGYLKIHIAVIVKSRKIPSMMRVTVDEHVHDSKALPELVDDIIKSDSVTVSNYW